MSKTIQPKGELYLTEDQFNNRDSAGTLEEGIVYNIIDPVGYATKSRATTSADGLMSSTDKSKLDGIEANANNYSLPAAGSSLGGVKSGGDVTISSGVITVNDDSHNHVISNVDGLQTALNGKASTAHNQASNTINSMTGYSKPSSTSAISQSDTLNSAIGKLEAALDGVATLLASI